MKTHRIELTEQGAATAADFFNSVFGEGEWSKTQAIAELQSCIEERLDSGEDTVYFCRDNSAQEHELSLSAGQDFTVETVEFE